MNSKIIYTPLMCSCLICKEEFSTKGIHTHYIWAHTNNQPRKSYKGSNKFQLRCSCLYCNIEVSVQNLAQHYEKHFKKISEKECPSCECLHTKEGRFCSRKCANKRTHTDETKKKLSDLNKGKKSKNHNEYCKVSWCAACGAIIRNEHKKACSNKCRHTLFVESGKKSAQKRIVRSKDEISLYNLCNSYFEKVTHNEPIFNGWDADILIHNLNLAILWNGPWHYQEMPHHNHSLTQVQNRDKIKLKEIISAGWTPVVFEDRYYTPTEAFNELVKMQALDSNQQQRGMNPI